MHMHKVKQNANCIALFRGFFAPSGEETGRPPGLFFGFLRGHSRSLSGISYSRRLRLVGDYFYSKQAALWRGNTAPLATEHSQLLDPDHRHTFTGQWNSHPSH